MSLLVSIFSLRGWRRWAGLIGFSLAMAALPGSIRAAGTNAAKPEPRQLREDLVKNRLQDDVFRKWGESRDSLGGMVLPPAARPNLSPEQARQLREKLDEQRYWMFANPDDAGKAPTLEELFRLDHAAPGLLNGLDAGTPRVLQRYYERQAQNRRGETNGAARDERDYRDDLSLKPEDRWRGKSARSQAPGTDSRSVFESAETAASQAISRLFQPNGGRTLAVTPNPGLFSDVFRPPAAIPMERSPETVQRRSDFQKLLEAPTAAAGNAFSPLPPVPANAGGFGGLNPVPAARNAAGFASPAGGSSLLGASTIPTVTAPVKSTVSLYQPVTPPRRRF